MREKTVRNLTRRDALKVLGVAALAGAAEFDAARPASAARELRYQPEKGATLRLLRWKRFVQGDEDQWMANTRKFFEVTGVAVQVESVGPGEVAPKAALAANVGAGPDIIYGAYDAPQLYPEKCLDLTELAQYLGDKYGGWYAACARYCTTNGRWIAVGMAFLTECVVYRKSMVQAAGFAEVPQDLPGFLKLCKALKERATPAGLALGNAGGDANTWCHWLIWAHGGRMVNERNEVVINSKETLAALEYGRELYPTFIPGTLSWLDPNNNKAFLAGEISLTYNGISIYYAAKTAQEPALKALAPDIFHAHLPIGPVNRPTELAVFTSAWVFKYTKYPNAAREYLRFMLEREQYERWQQASLGYITQSLRQYESNPVWTEDPKHTPFRDGGRMTLDTGYAGSLGHASAACLSDFVLVNMVAEAASGQSTPQAAAARAEQRARRYYRA
jgi:multiple sugar transport system substrate-binding protein